MDRVIVYIGLGSNLDNPNKQLDSAVVAINQLPTSELICESPRYQTAPIGPPGQDDYVNSVVKLRTKLSPHQLLCELQAIELAQDRKREVHWGPRTLDLDILMYDDAVISTDDLVIPHPYMHERRFVLQPLADIAPDLEVPCKGNIKKLLKACENQDVKPL